MLFEAVQTDSRGLWLSVAYFSFDSCPGIIIIFVKVCLFVIFCHRQYEALIRILLQE